MSLDEDDKPSPVRLRVDQFADDEAASEDKAPDFRAFARSLKKKTGVTQGIRKGMKDFESHGTAAQENVLESSRQAMEDLQAYTRTHGNDSWIRGWYYPDYWVGDTAANIKARARAKGDADNLGLLQNRVVVVEKAKGTAFQALGRIIPGVKRQDVAFQKIWLLPEEALLLVERGTLDLWWPYRSLEELMPGRLDSLEGLTGDHAPAPPLDIAVDDYESGLPLSLQAAYSLLIGRDGERGKVTLQKYQVYSTLKRSGYHIVPAEESRTSEGRDSPPPTMPPPTSIWQWLLSLIEGEVNSRAQPPYGPLVRPGLYRSYQPIFQQLDLIGRRTPLTQMQLPKEPEEPFRVHYHVWKDVRGSKSNPPPPDFRVAVVDAREFSIPTLEQMTALLESTPYNLPDPAWKGNRGRLHNRLKHGYRNVVIATVDGGVSSFTRFSEADFGGERLSETFDSPRERRGKKSKQRK